MIPKIAFIARKQILLAAFSLCLTSCSQGSPKSIPRINNALLQSASSHRAPSLSTQWLVTLARNNGRERIEVLNLLNARRVVMPGLNRPDARPISASISANGRRIAVIRQRDDKTELLIYRRNIEAIELLEINPKGVPRQVSISGSGKVLAVQISREGRWEIDLIKLAR